MFSKKSDGLIMVTGTSAMFCGLWQRCSARSSGNCVLTQAPYKPRDVVYRPLTNTQERGTRVLAAEIERRAAEDYERRLANNRSKR